MTLAEQWQQTKPASFKDVEEYFNILASYDQECYLEQIKGKAWVIFSDGSRHCMQQAN